MKGVATVNNIIPLAQVTNKPGTEIILVLSEAANARTYKAISKESTCSIGLTGEKSFASEYWETGKGDKELSSVQLTGEDYDLAKKGTSDFNVQFILGGLVSGSTYSLDPTKNSGTGKLTFTE